MIVALYGTNNIGKSVQAEMLRARFESEGEKAEHVKFPLYDLSPTGPLINEYLRGGNPRAFTPREFQLLNIQNRLAFAPALREKSAAAHIVLEDYTGTGIAWGIAAGVEKDLLVSLNKDIPAPDIEILLDGERFGTGHEEGHAHEENGTMQRRVREILLSLARENGWRIVRANASKEDVHKEIWSVVESFLKKKI